MPNMPEKLKLNFAEQISNKGGQKLNVTNSQGQNFDLFLTKDSQKVQAGSHGEILAEIWQYNTPKGERIWCGKLTSQNIQETPQNTPQSTNSQQVEYVPNGKDACICRQTAAKCVAPIIAAMKIDDRPPLEILGLALDICVPWSEWMLTGELPSLYKEPQGQGMTRNDDDIPF